jgi:hypothetical protein
VAVGDGDGGDGIHFDVASYENGMTALLEGRECLYGLRRLQVQRMVY